MKNGISRNAINGLGAIALVLILGLGLGLVALPRLLSALDYRSQTQSTAVQNATYQTQLATLEAAAANQDATTSAIEELQVALPSAAERDSVVEAIADASTTAGLTVDSIAIEPAAAWSARTYSEAAELLVGWSTISDTAAESTGDGAIERQQLAVTIAVSGSSFDAVVDFMDALQLADRTLTVSGGTIDISSEVSATIRISAYLYSKGQ